MVTVTEVKTIKFDDLMKVMKKYVLKSETRPVLQMVQFANGYFSATDSHHLIRVNSQYVTDIPADITEGTLYNPKEMKLVNEKWNYPDVSRLIPQYSESTVLINSNIKEFQAHVKEVKKVVKKDRNKVMKLQFKQNETIITGNGENDESYSAAMNSLYVEGKEISLHVSANYMNIALEAVKKLSKVSNDHVEMRMVSNMRPIQFTQYGVFDIMVLPVRIVK